MDKTVNTDLNDAYKRNNDLVEVLRKSKEENNKYKRFSNTNSSNPPSKDEPKIVSNSRTKAGLKKGGATCTHYASFHS